MPWLAQSQVVEVQLLSFLTSVLEVGVWSTSCPSIFTCGMGPWYPSYLRLSATQSQFRQVRRRENLLSPLEFEPWTVQPIGSCYTDYSIPSLAPKVDRYEHCEETSSSSLWDVCYHITLQHALYASNLDTCRYENPSSRIFLWHRLLVAHSCFVNFVCS